MSLATSNSFSDSDVLNHFGFSEFQPNECGYFRCGRGRVHYMTDLRKAFKSATKTAPKGKAAVANHDSEQDVDAVVLTLQEKFGEAAFKNKTQPNIHFDTVKFYVMCGRSDNFRLSVRSEHHSFDEMLMLLQGRPFKVNQSSDRNTIAINSIKGIEDLIQTITLCKALFQ